jgi:hypothetical protein
LDKAEIATTYRQDKKMKVAFNNDASFAFEFVRNLGFMYYGGSDLGEMIATAGLIKEGDEESWFTEFDKLVSVAQVIDVEIDRS